MNNKIKFLFSIFICLVTNNLSFAMQNQQQVQQQNQQQIDQNKKKKKKDDSDTQNDQINNQKLDNNTKNDSENKNFNTIKKKTIILCSICGLADCPYSRLADYNLTN